VEQIILVALAHLGKGLLVAIILYPQMLGDM
jgi:hypothetical protein